MKRIASHVRIFFKYNLLLATKWHKHKNNQNKIFQRSKIDHDKGMPKFNPNIEHEISKQ
jgi:hypothetical protein